MLKVYCSALLLALLSALPLVASATEAPSQPVSQSAEVQASTTAKVNLNTADAETLQRELLGIGEVKAQAIVAYRDEHGAFASVDELLEVNGIGEATLAKNRDKLSIN
ncbi:ComEA family DNA-binding protein [Pseudomonas sp.]|uniref:ComEA family DNA-binding protein n=1 Tax=Pseudomonas sp. TaxID=306 RepID=UPI003C76A8B0